MSDLDRLFELARFDESARYALHRELTRMGYDAPPNAPPPPPNPIWHARYAAASNFLALPNDAWHVFLCEAEELPTAQAVASLPPLNIESLIVIARVNGSRVFYDFCIETTDPTAHLDPSLSTGWLGPSPRDGLERLRDVLRQRTEHAWQAALLRLREMATIPSSPANSQDNP